MLVQSSTSFLEQSESLKIIPSKEPEMNVAKVCLDDKTEVSETSSALKYI